MRNYPFLLLCFLVINTTSLNAQKIGILSREKANKIDRLLNLYNSFGEISGTVLVAQDGKIIYKNAFGLANREWEIPNTIDTKFRIGSMSKQFIATMILQLVNEKKLKLKDNISTHLPYYRKDIGDKVTIHHLLNHTSGIPNYTSRPDFMTKMVRNYIPLVVLVKEYCSDDLKFSPGERFNYTNSGYVILGAIIESITKKNYEINLQERILNPLEMMDTGYDSHDKLIAKRAVGYHKVGFRIVNAMFIDMSIQNVAGGMYSTIEDLYKWERAIMGNKFLPKKLKKKMLKPEKGNYGYGCYIEDTPINVNGTETLQVHSSGRIFGFSGSSVSLIEENHTIIILTNNETTEIEEIIEKIKLTLYDMPYDLPRKSIIPIMLQSIEKEGIKVAINEYKNLKEAQEVVLTFRVSELDDLGKELMKLGKKEEAKLIYELNIEEFSEEYLPYFSLAEYYKREGKKKKAIEFYKLALEKNPDNKTIKSRLLSLGMKMD